MSLALITPFRACGTSSGTTRVRGELEVNMSGREGSNSNVSFQKDYTLIVSSVSLNESVSNSMLRPTILKVSVIISSVKTVKRQKEVHLSALCI